MLKKVLSKNCDGKEASFFTRPETNDELAIHEVRVKNEYELTEFEPDDIVLDVGGHIGIFAIECVLRGADVISFEPEPTNRELLLKNIGINGMSDRITVYDKAISSKGGKATFYLDDVNPGSHSLVQNCVDHPGINKIEVETITLDSVTSKFDYIKLLKLDCEGAEYDIVKNSTLYNIESIEAELHDVKLNQDLIEHLMKLGFYVRYVFGKRLGKVHAKR